MNKIKVIEYISSTFLVISIITAILGFLLLMATNVPMNIIEHIELVWAITAVLGVPSLYLLGIYYPSIKPNEVLSG